MTAEERSALKALIIRVSFKRGRFTLSSGRESFHYFNMKPTMLDPLGARVAGQALLRFTQEAKAAHLSGLEIGAVPLIGATAAMAGVFGASLESSFVRKKPKDHGTREVIEGLAPEVSLKDRRALIVDDVASTGASILKAADAIRAAGAIVEDAACLIDRREGAEEGLASAGIRLRSVFTVEDFDA